MRSICGGIRFQEVCGRCGPISRPYGTWVVAGYYQDVPTGRGTSGSGGLLSRHPREGDARDADNLEIIGKNPAAGSRDIGPFFRQCQAWLW